MAYKLRNRQLFEATVNGRKFTSTCYTQSTSYGFRHICTLGYNDTDVCRYIKGDIIGKVAYLNNTYERFTYETVLRKALENLRKYKEITKEEHDELYAILIERKAQAEHEQAEKDIAAFKTLYDKTSDAFKERAKDLPLMQSESDVQAVKGLMLLDVLMNSGE